MSIREIARRNGMSRKTVRKYFRAFEQAVGDNPDAEAIGHVPAAAGAL